MEGNWGRINAMPWLPRPHLVAWLCMALCCAGLACAAIAHATSNAGGASDDAMRRYEERRRAIAQHMEQATVYVVVVDKGEVDGVGSGFVVADGYIMTNAHVAEHGKEFYILREGFKATKAKLVKRSYKDDDLGEADFALLRFTPPVPIVPLTFNLQVGRMDRVSAWGFPFMITKYDQSTLSIFEGDISKVPNVVYTEGVVSTVVRSGKARNIIHTAAIASGNSGGPLINNWGEVVGINTWGTTEEDEGAVVNASIPADKIVDFMRSCGVEPRISQRSASPLAVAAAPAPAPARTQPAESGAASSSSSGAGGFDIPTMKRLLPSMQKQDPASSSEPPQGLSEDLVAVWRLAVDGDADAQALLAYTFYGGEDVPQDLDAALSWAKKSTALGSNDAAHLLGILYVLHDEYKNVPEGMKLLRQAADADPDYAALVAMLRFDGEALGVAYNAQESVHYAALGAQTGDMDAKAILGMQYYFGEGVDQNLQKAVELAREAEKAEHPLGLALLGWMHYTGRAFQGDPARALSYATDAAEMGEGHGMGLLAVMYYSSVMQKSPI